MKNEKTYQCGLVGFPGVGKSTLFNALTGRTDSRKMPRYAQLKQRADITVVDMCGISPGAPGLPAGAPFLKYLESSGLLIFVLRSNKPCSCGNSSKRIIEKYKYLLSVCCERENFAQKKQIIAINTNEDTNECYATSFSFAPIPVITVNAKTGFNLVKLEQSIRRIV